MRFYTSFYSYKGKARIRGYDDGKRFTDDYYYKPFCFVSSRQNSKYKTISGNSVDRIDFENIFKEREFLSKYKDVEGFEIYGMTGQKSIYAHIHEAFPGEMEYDPSLITTFNFDIETGRPEGGGFPDIDTANAPVVSITIRVKDRTIVLVDRDGYVPAEDVILFNLEDEEHLLMKFLDIWRAADPDIITGWNINGFDIPYMYNRIARLCGVDFANKLSPFEHIEDKEYYEKGQLRKIKIVHGLAVLDYMELYKKFSFSNEESYSLDNIANVVLGERKLDYSEYSGLFDLLDKNFQLFCEYNIKDVLLVERMEEKLGFIQQVLAIAYDAKVVYTDTMTTVGMWDVIIHNYLYDRNIVVNPRKEHDKDRSIAGGHVKSPIPNMYNWVCSFDLNSLYPSLIRQFNISPDTYVGQIPYFSTLSDGPNPQPETCVDVMLDGYITEDILQKLEEKNICVTALGTMFSNNKKGFLNALMERIYNDRVKHKKKMLEAKQQLEDIEHEMRKRGLL